MRLAAGIRRLIPYAFTCISAHENQHRISATVALDQGARTIAQMSLILARRHINMAIALLLDIRVYALPWLGAPPPHNMTAQPSRLSVVARQ